MVDFSQRTPVAVTTSRHAKVACFWMFVLLMVAFASGINLFLLINDFGGHVFVLAVTAVWTGASAVKLSDALFRISRG